MMQRPTDLNVTLIIGPGPYDGRVLEAVHRAAIPHRTIRSWPRFVVQASGADGSAATVIARNPAYDRLQWLTWAVWRRLPYAGRFETPRTLMFAVADLLSRR